ncbi:trans-sialidase [Trypanosoma cruzi cruzi]|uniref:Putative trans-sialidase n=1 Tax=Trypanosoma cruzi TaxID=5693 RepID=A0A2V2W9H5_TRYCR|nr:trans-sialidase [Trypanosoma cruzi cruzi]PWV03224.1 putative trans-sialidase [Trypanosoma cruzi]
MLSRVAAVMAPRTHNRRRVTGSSGRRREGGESERQRPNMSRRVFTSAVLLLVLVMVCCGTGGTAQDPEQASEPKFEWKEVKDEVGVTVESLGAPGLLKVGSDVFAVAEVQCKDSQNTVFTGIASQLLTKTADKEPMEEVLKDAKKDTQVLEEFTSGKAEKVDVSRPTAVVEGSNIYILVGKHSHGNVAECKAEAEKIKSGMLLVKGEVGEGVNKKIRWNETGGLPCTIGEEHKSLSQLIFGGGSGVKLRDATFLFPVEATKKKENEKGVKTASLIIHNAASWNLSKGMSADGCSDPSVLEWEKDKLMMMTACDDGRRRVYEIGDKGDSWTEALGTLSRVWGNKKGNERGVRSGFTTATIDGDGEMRNVMLVTLPVYSKGKEKGELRLWLTDNTHIVDIGSVSGETEDAAASSLLYKSGNNEEELIALYEKKGDEDKPSPGMVSVLLTEQLQRVKEVLATWKEVDERVSKLCLSESALKDVLSGDACSTVKITDGLVGFLSGNFSGTTWKDEYLGVNATLTKEEVATVATDNGVKFTGRGAWAEWPVGKQGDNQLYHFANYNFTLVATVSIHGVPKKDTPIPLIGAKMNDDSDNTVLLGLSYDKEKKWQALCSGQTTAELGSTWEPHTTYQVVIVLQNGTQGSAYVDGKSVGDESCVLKIADSKEISHFYIGGDGSDAGNTRNQEAFSVTVSNVMLYNRPLDGNEITALAKNKITIPKPEGPNTLVVATPSTAVSGQVAQKNVSVSTPGESTVNHESSVSSGEDEGTAGGTDEQGEKGIHPQHGEVNATALNSSIVNSSQGNNSDGGTMRGSGLLPSLLLLGLWGFAAQ